jgi:hypothetical protein
MARGKVCDALSVSNALVGFIGQTVKSVCHSLFTWMTTEDYAEKAAAQRAAKNEDGWKDLIHSPLPDFPVTLEKVP